MKCRLPQRLQDEYGYNRYQAGSIALKVPRQAARSVLVVKSEDVSGGSGSSGLWNVFNIIREGNGMSILCGTDFTPKAAEASNAAAALACRLNEPLILLHVVESMTQFPEQSVAPGLVQQRLREELHREAERLKEQFKVEVEEQLLGGIPDEVMVDLARRPGVRMIVLSNLGKRAGARWLLGSTSERTAQTASVPVLVVRGSTAFCEWATGKCHLKIMLGIEFSDTSDAAIRWAGELRRIAPCDIVGVHVVWPPQEQHRLGIGGSMSLASLHPEVERVATRDLEAKIARLRSIGEGIVRIRLGIGFGRTDFHLVQLAQEEQADLLVLGSHQRSGFGKVWNGSVAQGCLHHAPMSVALVPQAANIKPEAVPISKVNRVLVATDFSDVSNQAIPHAYSILQPGGTVFLIHVVNPFSIPNSVIEFMPQRSDEGSEQKALYAKAVEERLRSLIPEDFEKLGIKSEVHLIEGLDAAQAICAAAKRLGAGMICIGSHGRSGIAKAILGSVAQSVICRSPIPVITVRSPG